jgi:hypothetical protein
MRISPFILISVFFILVSCENVDDGSEVQVPRIPTDFVINLNLPDYADLQNPGGWLNLTGGSQGILVYRLTLTEFAVHDRHCTFQVPQGCRVSVDDSNLIAVDDECCGSTFSVVDGVPLSGSARRPLLRFQTQYNPNTNLLRIFN